MVDFELSEEQQMIRDTVGSFAREQIRPAARPADESGSIPAGLVSKRGNWDWFAARFRKNSAATAMRARRSPVRWWRKNSDTAICRSRSCAGAAADCVPDRGIWDRRAAREIPEALLRRQLRRRHCGADGTAVRLRSDRDAGDLASPTAAASSSTAPNATCRSRGSRTQFWCTRPRIRRLALQGWTLSRPARRQGAGDFRAREEYGSQGPGDLRGTLKDCRVDGAARVGGDQGSIFRA